MFDILIFFLYMMIIYATCYFSYRRGKIDGKPPVDNSALDRCSYIIAKHKKVLEGLHEELTSLEENLKEDA